MAVPVVNETQPFLVAKPQLIRPDPKQVALDTIKRFPKILKKLAE